MHIYWDILNTNHHSSAMSQGLDSRLPKMAANGASPSSSCPRVHMPPQGEEAGLGNTKAQAWAAGTQFCREWRPLPSGGLLVPGSLTTPYLDVLSRLLKDPSNRTASQGSGGPSTSAMALQDPLGKCLCKRPQITSPPEVALDTKAGGGTGRGESGSL